MKHCYRDTDILFLVEEFLSDHPEGSLHGFARFLIDSELEIRKYGIPDEDWPRTTWPNFTVSDDEVDKTNWPADIEGYVHDMWTGKLEKVVK